MDDTITYELTNRESAIITVALEEYHRYLTEREHGPKFKRSDVIPFEVRAIFRKLAPYANVTEMEG